MAKFLFWSGIIALALGLDADAQTTATLSATGGGVSKTLDLTLRVKTVLTGLSCNILDPEPGDILTCAVTISGPARTGGFPVTITVPSGFTGPASISVPANSTTQTFTLIRNNVIASKLQILSPKEVADWKFVNPKSLNSHVDQGGIDLRLLKIPDSFIESWKNTVSQHGPGSFGVDTSMENPILLTSYKIPGGQNQSFWFKTNAFYAEAPKKLTTMFWTIYGVGFSNAYVEFCYLDSKNVCRQS